MPTTPAQLIEQATRHASHLERLKASEYARIKAMLVKMQDELLAMLAREEITAWTRTRAERQLEAVRAMLASGYSTSIIPALSESIAGLAEYEAGFEARSLKAVAPAVSFTLPTGQQVVAAVYANPLLVNGPDGGSLLESFIDDWSRHQVRATTNSIRMGYALGETTTQVLRRVNEETIPMEQRGLRALVHTTLQHASTMARQQTWEANRDIIRGVRWLSTLDSRTSTQCFPAGTVVRSCGTNKNVFRANYAGQMFIIITASGKKLEGTPNHPVLTARGFLPLNKLNPGDKIISAAFNNGVIVVGDENVSVESDISKVYDSASKNPVFDVSGKSATAVDFYGDGQGMNGEVNIATANGHLSGNAISSIRNRISDMLFGFIEDSIALSSESDEPYLIVRERAAQVASQIKATIPEQAVNCALASTDSPCDINGLESLFEHLDSQEPVALDVYISLAALQMWHDFMALEQRRHGGCSDPILLPNASGGCSFSVKFDDVISAVSEFRSCHVYTLGSGLGFYIANGLIVKNCRSLDNQIFPVDKGPRPPAHVNCRSTTVAVLDDRFAFLEEGGTRAARDPETGKVESASATTSYYAWLKRQPAEVQDSIIGPTRGKLLRNGGLSAQRFAELQLGKNFMPLTLDEMRRLEPVAFSRAGI